MLASTVGNRGCRSGSWTAPETALRGVIGAIGRARLDRTHSNDRFITAAEAPIGVIVGP